jgi:membrane associated rhomboid family serine protease
MITLWLVLYIKNETTHQTPKKLLRVIGFCLLMLFPSGEAKQVSHLAHFSGGLFGILLGIIYLPWAKVKPNPSLFFVNFNRKLKFFNQPFWSRRPLRVWSI